MVRKMMKSEVNNEDGDEREWGDDDEDHSDGGADPSSPAPPSIGATSPLPRP